MISFTGNGRRLERSLAHELEKEGHQVLQAVKCKELESDKDAVKCSAREWTGEQFRTRDVLIFIGAVQIAVRLIASFIGSKTTDPAVLVLDEKGQYCIPILSGHIGGANEMAERIAEMAGALPVITTATDIRGKWAIDVFARKNHLYIEDMQKAKQISAKILEGKHIPKYARLVVVPASAEVMQSCMEKGYIQSLMAAGATITTPGCGACLGAHEGILAPGETCITTTNRNFPGRMGSTEADIYLASPATVAASILNGCITDPRNYL